MLFNYITGEKALVTRRKSILTSSDIDVLVDKIKDTQYEFYDKSYPRDAVKLIEYIFKDVFSSYGFSVRKKQVALSVSMYKNMLSQGIELSDVAVGFGKTHAYLVAGIVYRLVNVSHQPVVISTSSKKLQAAIKIEYLPEISNMLLEHGVIEKPFNAVIRKGMDKESLEMIRELRSLGISIFFEKENIDTAKATDEFLITLYSQIAQEEIVILSLYHIKL